MLLPQHWKRRPGSNRRRADYGSAALPLSYPAIWSCRSLCGSWLGRFEFAEPHRGTDNPVGLLLSQSISPLGDAAARQAYRPRKTGGGTEQANGFGFGHGHYV